MAEARKKLKLNVGHEEKESKYKLIDYNKKAIKRTESNSITFKVCEVKEEKFETVVMINEEPLFTESREFKLEKLIKDEITSKQNRDYIVDYEMGASAKKKKARNAKREINEIYEKTKVLQSSYGNNNIDEHKDIGENSFIHSAWVAYNDHHHLVIRPDNIWLSIMTQFSLYVNENSELLRDRFVDFQGKEKLKVMTSFPILEAPFDELTVEMADQIQLNIKDPSIREWVIPSFTTTTLSDKVVYSAVLMSTLKKYFDYTMGSRCGLPQVTLLGEIEDWLNLKERITRLTEFDNNDKHMKQWLDLLLPVIDKFIESAKGKPDIKWWNQIVDHESGSGYSLISGWITVFCVFNKDGKFQGKSNLKGLFSVSKEFKWPRINTSDIPKGYVSSPVLLVDSNGTRYKSTLYAGHISTRVENDTKLIPSLDWFIAAEINEKK